MKLSANVQHVLRLRNDHGWVKEFIYDSDADDFEYRVTDPHGFVRYSEIGTLDQFAKAVSRAALSPHQEATGE